MSNFVKYPTDLPSVASYAERIGARARSLLTLVVEEEAGDYWMDVAVVRLDPKNGTVSAPSGFEPTDREADDMKMAIQAAQWPEPNQSITSADRTRQPAEWADIDPSRWYDFYDQHGKLLMRQLRNDDDGRGFNRTRRKYVPYTYFTDGEWRPAEPGGELPLFGLERLSASTATVFLHEGAKAARAAQRMVDIYDGNVGATLGEKDEVARHPWIKQLSGAVHLGWIGGAMNPSRTDWSPLKAAGVARAYVVADNDYPGKSAIPRIAKQLHCPTRSIEFTEQWPVGFDLRDPFPANMFQGGAYIGPSFKTRLQPATWMTKMIPNPKGGRPLIVLRESAAQEWVYVESADVYAHTELGIIQDKDILNKILAPFSDSQNTAALINKTYQGRTAKLCYRPDIPKTVIDDGDATAINMFRPSTIQPKDGDASPWLEFLAYLFPIAEDRKEVERWLATLAARPEIRMRYSLLLMSTAHGTGKGTLCAILMQLVGKKNTGVPGEHNIQSEFNSWAVNKRLVTVGEIYQGHSFKVYNQLKPYVTDEYLEVNEKFRRSYYIENWIHFVLCSNDKRALKLDDGDRRWLVPLVTETPWPTAKWKEFYTWVNSGGIEIIMRWALDYGDYVETGDTAPQSDRKKTLVTDGKSDDWKRVRDEALRLCDPDQNHVGVYSAFEVRQAIVASARGVVHDDEASFGKALIAGGMMPVPARVRVRGKRLRVVATPLALEALRPLIAAVEATGDEAVSTDESKAAQAALNSKAADMLEDRQKPRFELGRAV